MGFSPLQLQHLMNIISILLFLPISLPVDGASWAGQFAGWAAHDWLALVGLSTAAYLGSGMLMQARLGGGDTHKGLLVVARDACLQSVARRGRGQACTASHPLAKPPSAAGLTQK